MLFEDDVVDIIDQPLPGTEDEDIEEDVSLSQKEKEILLEINDDEMDVDDFLKITENQNTRLQTESIVSKYHRVMSAVANKEGKDFVPLENTDPKEIPKLLAQFFKLMRTKKGEVYNASSYTTFLCGFTRYLADAFEPPIDVKNDPSFKIVRTVIKRMKALAQGTKGKKPGDNASKVVSPQHLRQAWKTGSIGRNNPDALTAATFIAVTTGLGCRSRKEVHSITNSSAADLGSAADDDPTATDDGHTAAADEPAAANDDPTATDDDPTAADDDDPTATDDGPAATDDDPAAADDDHTATDDGSAAADDDDSTEE